MLIEKNGVYKFLDEAPLKRFHFKTVLLSSFAYGLTGMNVMLIAPLASPIAREWNLSINEIGYLLSIGYFGMFIGALFFGKLADVVGRKKILVVTLLLGAVFTMLCGLSQSLYTFYILRFIAGLGLGGALPLPGVYVSEYIPVKHRGLFLGLVETSWVYGAMLSLLIPYFALPIFGWRGTFLIALAPIPLVPLIILSLPESIRYLVEKSKLKEAQRVITEIVGSHVKINLAKESSEVKELEYFFKDLFSRKYAKRTFLLFVLWGSLIYTYHGIFLWLPTIYAKRFNLKM